MNASNTSTGIYAYECARCCDLGKLGHSPDGEILYCDCLAGLDAHMAHLSKVMQEMAATLERIDYRRRRGIPLYRAEHYNDLCWAFERMKAEHDALGEEWTALKHDGIQLSEPESSFFPDYVNGELVPTA